MISFISSTGFFLLAGGAKGGLLDVNPGLIFWLFITFLILLLILKKLAWKPLISALETRENSIRDSIEKAENAKAEAEKILEENRKNLMLAEQTAQKIISEGREFSNKLKQEILDNANNESKKIIEQAKAEIERKKEEALGELRGTVADLVINATEKLIDEKLDDEKHRKLVNKFIDNLPKN